MKQEEMEVDEKYIVPSLVSAGDILKFLSRYKTRKSTLTEISKSLGINKSTCYRLLHTLTQMRMAAYDEETKTFSLGPALVILGNRASELIDYIPLAKDYLKEAVRMTNSTCALVQRMDDAWVYLAKEEPTTAIRVTINVGQRFKLTNGATGKLFLANMDYIDRKKTLDRLGLPKNTPKSITDREQFEEELNKIYQQGFSYSLEEHIPGIDGVSAPITDRSGFVQLAITSIMIHSDQSEETVLKTGENLKRLTSELSRKLYS